MPSLLRQSWLGATVRIQPDLASAGNTAESQSVYPRDLKSMKPQKESLGEVKHKLPG